MRSRLDRDARVRLATASAVALLTLLVFVRVVWHGFINYDDPFFVTMNGNIQGGVTARAIRWALTTPHEANWIPLAWLSHMLDITMFGLNPGGHHLTNVLLHAGSTVLLFCFLEKSTGERWKSAIVAFLFAVHPLHVESVAWVAERKDVLSAFFWMLTMLAYAGYVRNPGSVRYVACLASFSLGLLAKPMLVTLPFVLLLLDIWPLQRLGGESSRQLDFSALRRLLAEKVPFLLLAVAVSGITYFVQKAGGTVYESYTLASRAGKALTYYVAYLGKTLWPSALAVFYPMSIYPPPVMKILIAGLFLTTTTAGALLSPGRNRYLLTGWLWYLVTLIPVIGLVQIGQHSIADRYSYIPLVGIFIMFVWGIPDVVGEFPFRTLVLGVSSVAVLALCSVATFLQLGHWKDSVSLFRHATEVTTRNHVAYNNLGYALLEAGMVDDAIANFRLSIDAWPTSTIAMANLGDAFRRKGEYEQAIEAYSRIFPFEPGNEKGHYGLGCAFIAVGRHDLARNEYAILGNSGSPLAQLLLKEIERARPR